MPIIPGGWKVRSKTSSAELIMLCMVTTLGGGSGLYVRICIYRYIMEEHARAREFRDLFLFSVIPGL